MILPLLFPMSFTFFIPLGTSPKAAWNRGCFLLPTFMEVLLTLHQEAWCCLTSHLLGREPLLSVWLWHLTSGARALLHQVSFLQLARRRPVLTPRAQSGSPRPCVPGSSLPHRGVLWFPSSWIQIHNLSFRPCLIYLFIQQTPCAGPWARQG